jgi:hypothetical protein
MLKQNSASGLSSALDSLDEVIISALDVYLDICLRQVNPYIRLIMVPFRYMMTAQFIDNYEMLFPGNSPGVSQINPDDFIRLSEIYASLKRYIKAFLCRDISTKNINVRLELFSITFGIEQCKLRTIMVRLEQEMVLPESIEKIFPGLSFLFKDQ